MIDFKDPDLRERIAIRECVEARADQHVLPDAPQDRRTKNVFRVAMPDCEERAKVPRDGRAIEFLRRLAETRSNLGAKNPNGEGILKHGRNIEYLMRRAPFRHPIGSPACIIGLHAQSLRHVMLTDDEAQLHWKG